jgi:hypothetical protein
MAKIDIANGMVNDLLLFQKLLADEIGAFVNCGQIGTIVDNINNRKYKKGKDECWMFEDVAIEFYALDLEGDICPEIDPSLLKNAVLKLRGNMSGYRSVSYETTDPITSIDDKKVGFGLQVIIEIRELDNVIAQCAWHFDRHPDVKESGEKESTPKFHHPLYHVHFGGKEITKKKINSGNVLIVESPRLLHPPMDIILAIDFVLGNFYTSESLKKLFEKPLYHKIVENSRRRFWQPFFLGLASNFAVNYKFHSINHHEVSSTFAQNLIRYSEQH